MKKAQVAVLGVALLAGVGAFWLMSSSPAPEEQKVAVAPPAPVVSKVGVLVASNDLEVGRITRPDDFQWHQWPEDAIPGRALVQTPGIEAPPEDVVGAVVRTPIAAKEIVQKDRLVKTQGQGFMAALLKPGARAVAINIDAQGSSTAGGFIMPNDRVDVIRVSRDEQESRARGADAYVSETVLRDIRVLAIGQQITDTQAKGSAVGSSNATLELTPRQAEQVVTAQRSGGGVLTLVLRSALESKNKAPEDEDESERSMTVVRFGLPSSR